MEVVIHKNGLNPVQQSLLRIFNRSMTIEEANDIRKLFFNYYSEKLFEEVDRVVAEKGITEADYEALRNDHWRTKKSK